MDGGSWFYYKARMYEPKMGRFLQTDPVGYTDQMNMYAYVGNDPVNRNDPTGLAMTCTTSGNTKTCQGTKDDIGAMTKAMKGYIVTGATSAFAAVRNFAENAKASAQSEGVGGAISRGIEAIPGEGVAVGVVVGLTAKVEKAAALTWKTLAPERKNLVNAFMTQFGKGAAGAEKLAAHIGANGVPTGLDTEAFSIYRNTIQTIGGGKPITNASDVFNTRIGILDQILGGQ